MPWRSAALIPFFLAGCVFLSGCASAGPPAADGVATEAEWRALRSPRPEAHPAAERVTFSRVEFLGPYPWPASAPVDPGLGVGELVVAGLLRRTDVEFVERRRFAAAAASERRGEPRPPGRPPAGVSPSADLSAVAVWIPVSEEQAAVEVRLTDLESGDVAGATRVEISGSEPVALARSVVDGIVTVLDDLGRLPEGPTSPREAEAPGDDVEGADISDAALSAFLRGLAAEERWQWEGARRGYQEALARNSDFVEARTLLARAARLRLGGTLAES